MLGFLIAWATGNLEKYLGKDESMGYPIQDGENIPEWLAKLVYQGYVNVYGNTQSYERIRERGGFGKAEVLQLLNRLDIRTKESVVLLLQEK